MPPGWCCCVPPVRSTATRSSPLPTAQDAEGDTVGSMHGADDPGYDRVEDLILLQEAIGDLDDHHVGAGGSLLVDHRGQ